MKLNSEQLTIAQEYQKSKKNIAVLARAGTGKTSLLIAINKIRKSSGALFLVFTNASKDELIKREPSLSSKVKTTYSVGMSACRNFLQTSLNVNKWKYETILDDLLDSHTFVSHCQSLGIDPQIYKTRSIKSDLVMLLNSSLLNLCFDLESIELHIEEDFICNLEIESALIYDAIKAGLMEAMNGDISFSDMIAFPFSPYVPEEDRPGLFQTYPVVMVDEAQDLSRAQIEIVKMVSQGGQVIVVGDRNQAIFGFAGATGNSFDELVSDFDCETYPMSLCYRCPVEVLDYARAIVPDIRGEDRHGAVNEVYGLDDGYSLLREMSKQESYVISRTNSKLLKAALFLLEENIPFNFHRDNIEQKLKSKLSFIKETTPFNGLESALKAQAEHYFRKNNESQLDLMECLILILDSSGATKYSEVYSFMRKLFFKRAASILLGTVHSFKGNECKNVIAWGIEDFPHKLAKSKKQLEQEENLLYVLYTRAMESLFLVDTSEQN
jgi:DNA helicase II / ATP-dependent DNA helicase PcrA